jgi:hypothetical protein
VKVSGGRLCNLGGDRRVPDDERTGEFLAGDGRDVGIGDGKSTHEGTLA